MNLEEPRKRNVAFKLRIGDILKAKPAKDEEKFLFLELGENHVVRVNLIANVIEKFASEGEKKFASLTVDDASGQIRIKTFGEDIAIMKDIVQGDTVRIIGNVREYNDELYILPEIIKKLDPKWLLVRKLEIQNSRKDLPLESNAPLRDILLEKIKKAEPESGVDTEQLILDTEASPELINSEIKKLLEEGLIYEPRPGKLRYLG
jgi:RecG-like helicase